VIKKYFNNSSLKICKLNDLVLKRLALSVLLVLFMKTGVTVYAEKDRKGLTVTPAVQEILVNSKKETKEAKIKIENSTDWEVNLSLKANNYDYLNLEKSFNFDSGERADWIELKEEQVTLEKNSSKELEFKIINDDSLSPGAHYGVILMRVDSKNEIQDKNVSINQLISSLVFIKKEESEVYELRLEDLNYHKSICKLPKEVILNFRNQGNVHLVPRGRINLIDYRGKILAKGIINKKSAILFPRTIKEEKIELNFIDKTRFIFPGKYSLELRYHHEDSDEEKVFNTSFYYVSWLYLVVFVLVFIIILILIKKRKRKEKK
jgi:hypothetical protein